MPKPFILLALLACLFSKGVVAQEATGIQVNALTSAERDSIVRQIQGQDDIRLIYACVPAGILVFATDQPGSSRATFRSRALNTVSTLIAPDRIGPAELNLHAAEMACAAVRGE